MSARILLVKADAGVAHDIRVSLEGLGYSVLQPVASAVEAIHAVVALRPDVVLLDIDLGGVVDGVEVATFIAGKHGPPVVYLTHHANDARLARTTQPGACGHVPAPFRSGDLRVAIEVALQRRELERRFSERERWFATTLRSLGEAVIATDPAQRITFMNAVAERVTGWTASDAAGKHLHDVLDLVDEATGARVESPLGHALEGGFTVNLPLALLASARGERRLVTDSAAPIVDDDGKTLGGVVVFRDVTEQRRLEERVARSERLAAIGTMSAGMTHEINNPLAYVLANVTVAIDGLREIQTGLRAIGSSAAAQLASRAAEVADALSDAREGSERVHRIVLDLKRFGRLDKADVTILELSHVLEGAIRMTEHVVRHHAHVRRSYGTTPFVEAAEGQLGQVFINLLVNAAQAVGEGHGETQEIVVATRTDPRGWAVAEIRDEGPGMTRETQRRIFEPFFTTKGIGQGSGLGLAITHSIVESLGGDISVESEVGKGTTFRVSLPPAVRRESKLPAAAEPAIAARRGRVLIIDDEPAIGRVLGRVLEDEHDVSLVTDPREALSRIVAGERYDVAFCDLMMPSMTGMDFIDAVQRHDPDLARRIVVVTGGAFTERATEFLEKTTHATLSKPFDTEAIKRIVADYVGSPGSDPADRGHRA